MLTPSLPAVQNGKVFLVLRGELEFRFDSLFYAEKPDTTGFIRLGSVVNIKGGKRIPKGMSYSEDETEYLYLRVDDIDEFGAIKFENLKFISKEIFDVLESYELNEKEVVISIAGTIGKISFLKNAPNGKRIILTENAAKLVIKKNELIPDYLKILLELPIVQKQMKLAYIQTTIPKLALERIDNLKIPQTPPLEIQRQIVQRFETAYFAKQEKEAEAARLLANIDSYLLEQLGITLPQAAEKKTTFFVCSEKVSGGRFDPIAYNAERLLALKAIEGGRFSAHKLKHVVFSAKTIVSESDNLPYIGLENIESNTGRFVEKNEKSSFGSAVWFSKGQILFPKLRPYLNKVYLSDFEGVCSTEFHVFDSRNESVSNDYLAIFLRSQLVVSQTKYLMSGNTLPRLQTEDIENLLVPVPPIDIQIEIVLKIEALRAQAQKLEAEAKAEVEAAKKEVEMIILGGGGSMEI